MAALSDQYCNHISVFFYILGIGLIMAIKQYSKHIADLLNSKAALCVKNLLMTHNEINIYVFLFTPRDALSSTKNLHYYLVGDTTISTLKSLFLH